MGNRCSCDDKDKWDMDHLVEESLKGDAEDEANFNTPEENKYKSAEPYGINKLSSLKDKNGSKNLKDVLNESEIIQD